jgi:putative peptide zinc metalloprotease protein
MTVTAPHAPARDVLVLADGVELVGEYEDSGFKEPPLLARRADGQMIQLTRLVYLVADAADGERDEEAVAEVVSERDGRRVSADNVRLLADKQLRPLGVLALRDGSTPELPKRQALFALRCRRPILGERTVNGIARMLTWLHRQPIQLLLLLALAAFDLWLFGVHGIAPALRAVIYDPTLLLAVLSSTVIAAAWHECGHASACRYGGARPGVVGGGLYLGWPAFF